MANRAALPSAPPPLAHRLAAEWRGVQDLAIRNPGRLTDLQRRDTSITLRLRHTPALPCAAANPDGDLLTTHDVRIEFPAFFPAVPMELYLATPVAHPNIHPETGFVCLWDKHRVSNTVEQALQKTVAILGWQLHNAEVPHVMQPEALSRLATEGDQIRQRLSAPPLAGSPSGNFLSPAPGYLADRRRRRLS